MSLTSIIISHMMINSVNNKNEYFNKHVAPIIIHYEGSKFINDPKDPGGPTKYGITLKTLRRISGKKTSINTLKNLTEQKAIKYYKEYFWDRYGAYKIKNRRLSLTLLLSQINLGPYRPNLLIQKDVNKLCHTHIVTDGIIGNKSIKAINNCRYLWPGYPYVLYYFYADSKSIKPVWRWAKKGLKRRIFFGVNHE